MKHWWKW